MKAPCSILQLVPSMEGGGVERAVIEITQYACAQGYIMHVISKGGVLVDGVEQAGGQHYMMNIGSKNPIIAVINVVRLMMFCRRYNIALIHARSRMPAWVGYIASSMLGIKFMTTFHGSYNFSNPIKKYYNSIMCRGNPTIAISQFIAHHIKAYYNKPVNMAVIARGVDTAIFNPNLYKAATLDYIYDKYTIPRDKKLLMVVGRYSAWKGQDLLIQALSLLRRQDLHALFVGYLPRDDKYYQFYKQLAYDYNCAKQCHFIGYNSPDLAALYMLSDMVISTSKDPEAFGRVTIEASAMAAIVIAPNHGGAMEQLNDGDNGFLYQPNNIDSLVHVINHVLGLPRDTLEHIKQAAHDNAANNYDIALLQEKTIALYNNILQG